MKLVVGLGNPGKEYKNTRHNIGFNLLDSIASNNGYSFKKDKKFNCEICETNINGEKVLLVKPLSFMNLSGTVVSKIVSFYDINISDILVIQDDLDMEFGKIRIVKIGISNNKDIDTKDYVLGKFSKNDIKNLDHIYDKLDNIISDFIDMDIDKLKQKYNSMNNN